MEKKLFYVLLFAAATGLCTGAFLKSLWKEKEKHV